MEMKYGKFKGNVNLVDSVDGDKSVLLSFRYKYW